MKMRIHNQLADWLFKCTHMLYATWIYTDRLRWTFYASICFICTDNRVKVHAWNASHSTWTCIEKYKKKKKFSSTSRFFTGYHFLCDVHQHSIIELATVSFLLFAMLMIRTHFNSRRENIFEEKKKSCQSVNKCCINKT